MMCLETLNDVRNEETARLSTTSQLQRDRGATPTATFKAQQKVWKCERKEAGSETTGRREPTLEKPAAAMSSSESSIKAQPSQPTQPTVPPIENQHLRSQLTEPWAAQNLVQNQSLWFVAYQLRAPSSPKKSGESVDGTMKTRSCCKGRKWSWALADAATDCKAVHEAAAAAVASS